jgi:hypothetical protein
MMRVPRACSVVAGAAVIERFWGTHADPPGLDVGLVVGVVMRSAPERSFCFFNAVGQGIVQTDRVGEITLRALRDRDHGPPGGDRKGKRTT